MKNLMELALEATKANVVKSSTRESVNDALVRVLYDGKEKLDRISLIARLSLDRLIDQHGQDTVESWSKDEFEKNMAGVNKTVKNGIDTSVSHSKNNSSFHFNEKYNHLKLEEKNGLWQITKRRQEELLNDKK